MSTIYALATMQGTAISRTALCADCWGDVDYRKEAVQYALVDSDYRTPEHDHWDFGDWQDCTGNDALSCQHCGATGDDSLGTIPATGQSYADYFDRGQDDRDHADFLEAQARANESRED